MTVESTQYGLHIITQTEGYVVWSGGPLEKPVDIISIRARSPRPTKAAILWQPRGGKPGELAQIAANIPGGGALEQTDIIMNEYPEWNWETGQLGLWLPAGSDVLIEEIQFRHWPFYERTIERWKSFWTFDTFRPYSINFLWGPLVAGNGPVREHLYDILPPNAPSVTRYFYVFIALAAAITLITALKKSRRPAALGGFLAVCAALWLIFDIRMGAEILSYAAHDMNSYVLAEPNERELRNYDTIHATIDRMIPAIQKHEIFVMLAPFREVYFPLLRYKAYPSLIVTDPVAESGATAWAVFERDDVRIDEQGRLVQGEAVMTPPGHVEVPVSNNTFLFVVP